MLEADPDAVRTLKSHIEREEPEWVERARDEWESFQDVESTAFWAEVPLQTTVAILLNLHERGELRVDDEL